MLESHPEFTAEPSGDVSEEVRSGKEIPRVYSGARSAAIDGGGPLDKILDALRAIGYPVRQKDRQWRARCPYHGGNSHTSLSVAETPDGTALVHCFSGCAPADVLGVLGLRLRDLYVPDPTLEMDKAWQQRQLAKLGLAVVQGGASYSVSGISFRRMSAIEPETLEWLWAGYIPLGAITMLEGDPGLGKSMLTLNLAGIVTGKRKWLPDGTPTEVDGGVVVISLEDHLAATIRPRLDAVKGADLDRIIPLDTVPDDKGLLRQIAIPNDLPLIERAIREVDAKLLILDPLAAILDAGHNINSDQDVRRALAPLAEMAGRTGCAAVVLRHLGKESGRSAIYRGAGSIGVIGAARAGLLVAKSPDDPEHERIFSQTKSNLGTPKSSLSYRIEEADNGVGYVVWGGTSIYGADQLVSQSVDESPRQAEAADFLRDLLADGPVYAKQVQEDAKAMGIASRTLDRAKRRLGVTAIREGGLGPTGKWQWSLPGSVPEVDLDI